MIPKIKTLAQHYMYVMSRQKRFEELQLLMEHMDMFPTKKREYEIECTQIYYDTESFIERVERSAKYN